MRGILTLARNYFFIGSKGVSFSSKELLTRIFKYHVRIVFTNPILFPLMILKYDLSEGDLSEGGASRLSDEEAVAA